MCLLQFLERPLEAASKSGLIPINMLNVKVSKVTAEANCFQPETEKVYRWSLDQQL